jgi:cephalosporin-C deacetylase-like acetyl esterase
MKRIFNIGSACLFFVVLAAAAQTLTVTPDQGGVYAAGEEAGWSISLMDEEKPLSGNVTYMLKDGGLKAIDEGVIQVVDGAGRMNAAGKDSGTLLLELNYGAVQAFGGAVFNWPSIQPSAPEPSDFDEFWQSKVAELDAVPMNVVLEKVEIPGDVDYWKITMDNVRGTQIHGQIARPKEFKGTLPAMLQVQYAGVYPLKKKWVTGPASEGWLAMNIMAHDLPIDRDQQFYKDLSEGALNNYPKIGSESRDSSYFLRMVLSCYRAVEYILQRPDWDGKVLFVKGASQGGLQSIMLAGLHPAVTAVSARVPAGCDHTGELAGREPGWPKWYRCDTGSEKELDACKYYDAVNFARRVTCPALVGVGLIDTTSPPAGVIAMFNQLDGPKRLEIMPIARHRSKNGSHDGFYQLEQAWSEALKEGRSLPMD